MKQSVIGEIYASWTKSELKKLNKFISTSHWSKSETIVQCHNCLASYASKDRLDILNKESLFLETYPNDSYTDNKLRFTLNRLLEAIKEFILLEENEKRNVHSEKIWMDFIQNKRLKKNILLNIESDFSPQNMQNKFIYNYYKSVIKGNYLFHFTSSVEDKFNALLAMTKKAEEFSDYVFLRQYCLLLTFTNVYKSAEFQVALSKYNEIKDNVGYKDLPEFEVNIALIEMLHHNEHALYYTYKEKVFDYFHLWDEEDKLHSFPIFSTIQQLR